MVTDTWTFQTAQKNEEVKSADRAFAKAGAAPGTTAGVELVFPIASLQMPDSGHSIRIQACRLPGFKTDRQFPRATRATACRVPSLCEPFPAAPTSHSFTEFCFIFKGRSSLPFASLQNPTAFCCLKGAQACRLPGFRTTKRPPAPLGPQLAVLPRATEATAFCF